MENVTIGQIVAAISTISVIGAFIVAIYRMYKSAIDNRFKQLEKDVEELRNKQKEQNKDIKESKDERYILIKGILACLDGLKQSGANGNVTTTYNEINEFLMKKSHD